MPLFISDMLYATRIINSVAAFYPATECSGRPTTTSVYCKLPLDTAPCFLKKIAPTILNTIKKIMFGRKRKLRDKPAGFIYIASNQGMPGIIKIGMTYKPPATRLAELYTTGVPHPFDLEYQCRVPDRHAAERYLHDFFDDKRVNDSREFFAVSANDAAKVTHSRVANKKIRYRKPASKFKRFIVLSLILIIGAAALYKTGHITETVDTMLPRVRDYVNEFMSRWLAPN